MNLKKLLTSAVLSISLCQSAFAAPVEIDKVIGIVNQGVILKSEVDTIVNRVKKQAEEQSQELPKDETLRVQAVERLVNQTLMMQMAERMGLEISDSQLDQTLASMAKEQGGSIADLRRTIEGSGESFQAYREEIRKEITTQQVMRANVDRRVYVSEQEVDNLLKIMESQGQNAEEYDIGHILIDIPSDASADEIASAKTRADKVIELLNDEQEFKRIAISSSSGSQALEGGQLGWMGINEMPSLFAEAVKGKKQGAIIGPLRSGAGFHIIKVQDVRGRQVVETTETRSRHILIKPSIILSEEKARSMLAGFVKDLRADKADFAKLAKEYSEDPGSALKGGEYDWADPTSYVPAFRDTLLSLKQNEISEPFRSQFGWHIVQLLDTRVADKTEQAKRNRAHGMLFNRKFKEESFNWQQEMREQAHVEIFPIDE
ncbi:MULTISPECIES: peptidylprolyl isomerase SurA [Pseudoalteromonas]|uniref:Chaperone SurA n=3 Tax=Pseudoalteromonas TaxID=53246 RepID=SURA_PSET1|nr:MULTISPECIES: peptidylprolyl isomerase SurA [Pseudoalteromonas]Q3IFD3.1 RecName: Full=Chaperone SurA; AltName: Full=Peptidyl-prolyl cis-trans isomerase SurA; Short=PPIase SurA; AltName: Full=Rotamase SurA; Flags: Precursor [Pseudoalteromonas translucida TAC125]ASM55250.1 peptidyl-prolyl cis-trans isomerase SurA [Pseudoalteromonas nigrifaciens]MBB1369410.1 peptidylprolyl isomerase SurA [Pseudoalteromonas sp. SR45-4]MBE0419844.1 peptidylprolyl isomerase SurA [Pseudoalteromonas nigrifaciens]MB|tara:strand:+ start:32633 stop:33928 length:1296 start_codon:yes stop_codon:yes gene_type:complete